MFLVSEYNCTEHAWVNLVGSSAVIIFKKIIINKYNYPIRKGNQKSYILIQK